MSTSTDDHVTPTFTGAAGFRDLLRTILPAVPFDTTRRDGDEGWFGPASTTWAVFRSRTQVIGAVRSMWLQALHPSVLQAVVDSNGFRDAPMARVARTVEWLSVVVFGASDEAQAACERLNRVHACITGERADGVAYRADDPDLLLWVHCTLVDSLRAAHERFGGVPVDVDELVAEWARVGEALGAHGVPQNAEELGDVMHAFRSDLDGSALARATVRSIEGFRVPHGAGLLLRGVREMATSTLTPFQRGLCDLPYETGEDVRCRLALWMLRHKPSHSMAAAYSRIGGGA